MLSGRTFDAVLMIRFLTCFPNAEDRRRLLAIARGAINPNGVLYVHDFLLSDEYRWRYDDAVSKGMSYGDFPVMSGDGNVRYVAHHHTEQEARAMLDGCEPSHPLPIRIGVRANLHVQVPADRFEHVIGHAHLGRPGDDRVPKIVEAQAVQARLVNISFVASRGSWIFSSTRSVEMPTNQQILTFQHMAAVKSLHPVHRHPVCPLHVRCTFASGILRNDGSRPAFRERRRSKPRGDIDMSGTHLSSTAPTLSLDVKDGGRYAYRRFGSGAPSRCCSSSTSPGLSITGIPR